MKKVGLHIVLVIFLVLLALPMVQMRFRIFREKPLNGAFHLSDKPVFNKEKWLSGEFQSGIETYLKDHTGFRNFLVRLENQIDFSFFSEAHAEGVVIGKKNQLYEYDYIRSWLAIDYPGDSFVEEKLRRTKFVQQYLKREKNIDLVVVFEPGKASFYPEDIPGEYSKLKHGPSTYDRFVEKARETGIDFIDLQHYFMAMKPGAKYPLFPPHGTHWSEYGMSFAADSLLKFIQDRRHIALTSVRVKSVETSKKPRYTDDDVLKTMNVLIPSNRTKLAYPQLEIDTAHPGEKPNVLVVADSYYWNIFNTKIPKYVFGNEAFWYFNSLVYPDYYNDKLYTEDLDLKEEVEKQQVVFLMITERFLHKFDWRFIDQLYSLYTPGWLKDPVYDNINNIMQVENWYNDMIEKAAEKKIPLEEALITEGKYIYKKEDTLGYMIHYGLEHYQQIIANDTGWMGFVINQAKQKNVPVEEMLRQNASYVFNNEKPALYKMYQGLHDEITRLESDPKALDTLKEQAAYYCMDLDEYIGHKAWPVFMEDEIERTCNAIRNDPPWLASVRMKAVKKGVSVEKMIRLDAEYMWQQRLKNF